MNVSTTTTALQALLRQIEPAVAPPVARAPSPQIQKAEAAAAQVTPNGKTVFNPNSPRGTYLNIVV